MNIAETEIELADLIREPFDASEFPFRLLEIYNAPKATVTKLRNGTQKKGERAGDVLWSRKLYFRAAGEGRAAATLDDLRETKATKSQKPRFLMATDGHEVAAYDTKADDTLHCDYAKLNDHFDFFLPVAGIDKYEAVAENPADRHGVMKPDEITSTAPIVTRIGSGRLFHGADADSNAVLPQLPNNRLTHIRSDVGKIFSGCDMDRRMNGRGHGHI
jgi:hypothetical protein